MSHRIRHLQTSLITVLCFMAVLTLVACTSIFATPTPTATPTPEPTATSASTPTPRATSTPRPTRTPVEVRQVKILRNDVEVGRVSKFGSIYQVEIQIVGEVQNTGDVSLQDLKVHLHYYSVEIEAAAKSIGTLAPGAKKSYRIDHTLMGSSADDLANQVEKLAVSFSDTKGTVPLDK